eukprot:366153-Chlamydomonas_euryale.AAC.1
MPAVACEPATSQHTTLTGEGRVLKLWHLPGVSHTVLQLLHAQRQTSCVFQSSVGAAMAGPRISPELRRPPQSPHLRHTCVCCRHGVDANF